MRVVSGTAKGKRLRGAVSRGTRATTERVRAAIFNILYGELYQRGRVLDLFAGSGSLGIEALSRGAAWADFVERDHRQCQVIQSNLETTGFSSSARVHCSDVDQSLRTLRGAYQLILLDPPYVLQDLDTLLDRIGEEEELVDRGGMVVVGHSRFLNLRSQYGHLRLNSHRRYGDNLVAFFQRENDES